MDFSNLTKKELIHIINYLIANPFRNTERDLLQELNHYRITEILSQQQKISEKNALSTDIEEMFSLDNKYEALSKKLQKLRT